MTPYLRKIDGRFGTKQDSQEVKALQLLLSGREISHEALKSFIANKDPENLTSNFSKVAIYRLRKAMEPLDIKVKTIWGFGYQMTKENIDKVKAHIENAKPVAVEF